ncbi:MAG: DUF86 domain-containing protein [Gammaproteobacteria bacterium]|nr:DUF86 domain-containing protein [Gammaproteobacteria bacterium]MDE0303070.1 DUF86 domain-containing protein [Gammaproteobacteria bacterium]MDE0612077.1 DUF86 domain-containing protein [Gammaproteobacteria bacterium]
MRRDPSYLLDMLSSARDAMEFAAELTFHEFEQSLLHRNAILKSIEIIGEAASRLSDEIKEAHPEIEWRKIVGMRHHLVHGYFSVNNARVWQVVQNDLPVLITQLEPIVPPEAEQ